MFGLHYSGLLFIINIKICISLFGSNLYYISPDNYSINALDSTVLSPITYEIPCGLSPNKDRIVGGSQATEGQFPWLVSIQFLIGQQFKHVCAGSVINSKWIVTGAHCVYEKTPQQFLIKAGKHMLNESEPFEQTRNLSKIIIRKNFDIFYMNEDLALLQLEIPLELNENHVAPICLPEENRKFTGEAVVAGWGQVSENGNVSQVLLKTKLPLISREECKNSLEEFRTTSMQCQLCTEERKGGKDACMGDSGGALMCYDDSTERYYLCGIISWGIGCARAGYPGVYTEVACYSGWIAGTLNTTV